MDYRALMNKSAFFFFFFLILPFDAFPQTRQENANADIIAASAPDSVESSIHTLSDYFLEYLASEKELIRAFYFWTANKIEYDTEKKFNFSSSDNPAAIISETLKKRRAVCQGYSEVFHALCDAAGIENYVVQGYTRQNGNVVYINHAWVVAHIDTSWYFFDPTWGSGVVTNGRFIRKFTLEYFMVKPAVFIKSHMPFDPLWQCLYYSFSPENFAQNNFPAKAMEKYFYYPDSIGVYKQLTTHEKEAASLRRIEGNGVGNNSILAYVQYLKNCLEIGRINKQNEIQNELVNQFNQAVNHYNTGAALFNRYIDYWNRQFIPQRPDAEIKQMLDTCDFHLAGSHKILSEINPQDETLRKNVEALLSSLQDIQKKVEDHKAFLRNYFATQKNSRASLFRRYTWMGIPVN